MDYLWISLVLVSRYVAQILNVFAFRAELMVVGREVSYSSLLKQSVSTQRARLYESNGLDLDL